MNTPVDTTIDVETLSDTALEAYEATIRAQIDALKGRLWEIDVERWSRNAFPMPASVPVMAEYEYAA